MELTQEQLDKMLLEAMYEGAEICVYYYTDDNLDARKKIAKRLVDEAIAKGK